MLKRTFFRTNVFWILPVSYIAGAILLAWGIDLADRSPAVDLQSWIPDILLTRSDIAKEVLTAIATSLLTMTTITFSVMMVVLSTYASQFSPRVLPNFTKSSVMQHAQGIFFAGFVFSVTSLLFLKRTSPEQQVPEAAIGVILSVLCLVFFIYFIHRVSLSIQVNHLIADIAVHARKMIGGVHPGEEPDHPTQEAALVVNAEEEGYIRSVRYDKWVSYCESIGGSARIITRVGQFVNKGDRLAVVQGKKLEAKSAAPLKKWIEIGSTRTNEQDLEFVLEKIVEMALRAISPSINDPNTAIYCIRELGNLLERISQWQGTYWIYSDSTGHARLHVPFIPFGELLYKVFYQIRHYGASDISVSSALLDALIHIVEEKPDRVKDEVWSISRYVYDNIDPKVIHEPDRKYLLTKWDRLKQLCK